ncbi:hypothetical protein KDN34_14285 [Shewanella yunxiaonensis]|uniref:DUF4145 domain-containing protein n=1 Tax=Shewanella yunxiaonensis TaxID=2829809 RepID=A0ABX7YTB4_9GAMM|nr:hypothetical protein [Shewanella yunxiaonensis]QUN05351.1 hypothetical protein KDN34_14285 [Shewanella yunxiaonensis]
MKNDSINKFNHNIHAVIFKCNSCDLGNVKVMDGYKNSLELLNYRVQKLEQASSNTIPSGSYPLSITSGLISSVSAALIAYFLNYYFWKKIRKYNRLSHFAVLTLKNLEVFENAVIEYWSSNYTIRKNSSRDRKTELEIIIKTKFDIIKNSSNSMLDRISDENGGDKEIINNLVGEIYDLATGEDFESVNRKINVPLAHKTIKKCEDLKQTLIKYSESI